MSEKLKDYRGVRTCVNYRKDKVASLHEKKSTLCNININLAIASFLGKISDSLNDDGSTSFFSKSCLSV